MVPLSVFSGVLRAPRCVAMSFRAALPRDTALRCGLGVRLKARRGMMPLRRTPPSEVGFASNAVWSGVASNAVWSGVV